ncbi:CPXV166 protein, partial [Monkeypox virus]
MTSILNTLRF